MDAIFTKTDKDKAKVKHNKLWFKRATVDFPLNDEQYEIFKKGYAPDCACRFEPVYMDGWFYITRSGFWLLKFKYEKKKKDGLWHITANYDTWHTPGYSVMLNVIGEGRFERPIFTELDIKRYLKALKNTARVPLAVDSKPSRCEICHSKVKPVSIGEPTPETWRKIERGQLIDYGCCLSEDTPEWACPTCGQGYKDRNDTWNINMSYIIYSRRPKVCKKCGGKLLEIVYGYHTSIAFDMADRGEVILGGCCIDDDQPDMVCNDCHQGYQRIIPEYLREDASTDMQDDDIEEEATGNCDEDAAKDLLYDKFSAIEIKMIGATGAMNRGVPMEEALKKYGLTKQEYEHGSRLILLDDEW